MFEAASGLFPKKIKVTLIDAASGNRLGKYKIPAELLPAAFNRPTTLEIGSINWQVLRADPVLAEDFLFTKKLCLQVQHASNTSALQLKFGLPTICSDHLTIEEDGFYHDFPLEIGQTEWRQIEFFSLKQSGVIKEALKKVETILTSQPNPLLGYEQQYIRDNTLHIGLEIPWGEFCAQLINPVKGNIFYKNNGFVLNGFALRSDSHDYYGIMEDGFIKTLCLNQFDWVDDEFMRVLSIYELSLVDWCNASCINAEAGEEPQSQFVKI
jgi:hypothetical protein